MTPGMARVAATLLLVWSVAAAVSALATARARVADASARLESELRPLLAALPARGTIGYVAADGSEELQSASLAHTAATLSAVHVAQYTLVPRIVTVGAGPDFLVVRRAGAQESEPGVPGYEPVGAWSGEHRVYRRAR